MIRVVLAVLLTSALFAVALPSAESADRERSAALVTADLEALGDTAERLAAENDPVAPSETPAARTVVLEIPEPTFAERGRIRLRSTELRWEPVGARNRTVEPPVPLHLETPIVVTDRSRLRLSFVRIDDRSVVSVRLLDSPRV